MNVCLALSQEATAIPTADGPVIVVPDPIEPGQIITDVGSIIFYLLAAFGVGGVAGIAGFGIIANRLLKNKDALDAMERLATNTIPLSALEVINSIAETAAKVAELVAVITDRLPNVIPPGDPTESSASGDQ